ncbi:MAG: hypothetical protein EBS05_17465 [Proteobacteria bacterium]|nr:hypothetical protein [Pseudomonadota bacterium]
MFAVLPILFGGASALAQNGSFSALAGEYAVSGAIPGDQTRPALAFGAAGGYVVWQDNVTDGDGLGISAQRLNSNLSGSLAPFRVNQIAAGHQEAPRVAVLPNGGAVFVWQGGALGFQKIYARFLNPDGTFATGDVLVGADTNQPSLTPAVAVLTGGDVVVTWSRMEADGNLQGICAQRLSSTGTPLGGEWIVNQASLYSQTKPAITALPDGGFVIAWASEVLRGLDTNSIAPGGEGAFDSYTVDIVARRFDAAGTAAGNEFKVNTQPYICDNPAVAAAGDGSFTVVWEQRDAVVANNSLDIFARSFTAAGAPVSTPAVVNATTYGDQYAPQLAVQGNAYLVVWTSLGQDGSFEGIYGRSITTSGAPSGDELLVNTTTISRQLYPAVAADSSGRLLVVWSSFAGVATGSDLYAQRYASGQPVPTPPAPSVNAVSQSRLSVTWAELAGYDVVSYTVYLDGGTNALSTTNQFLTISNLVAGSSHTFQMDYLLRDGRRSSRSPIATGVTWGEDANFDGLPDDWQALYWGSNPLGWPGANADSDGDGATNLQEFLAGTDPTRPDSSLRLALVRTGQGLWLNWNTMPGLVYQVQYSTNATIWQNVGKARFAPGGTDAIPVGGSDVNLYRIIRIR